MHPNQEKYLRQRVLIVKSDDYTYLMPFAEEDDYFFLKTIIPSLDVEALENAHTGADTAQNRNGNKLHSS